MSEKGNALFVPPFDKEVTYIIKGIALVLMFFHHFFTFPAWWGTDVSYSLLKQLSKYLCLPAKICVPIFAFLTGYFYYYRSEKSFRYSFHKIIDFLIPYWFIFSLYAIAAILLTGYRYSLRGFLLELFALQRPTMIFCWYVWFYCLTMLILPILTPRLSHNALSAFINGILVPVIISQMLIYLFRTHKTIVNMLVNWQTFFPSVISGFACAKYQVLETLQCKNIAKQNQIARIVILSLIAVLAAFFRYVSPTISIGEMPFFSSKVYFQITLDVLYAPAFVFSMVLLFRDLTWKPLRIVLYHLGKNSLNMWFIHCIFFNNMKEIFRPILYAPKNPFFVLCWGLVLCYVFSRLLDIPIQKIQRAKNHLFFARDLSQKNRA